MGERNKITQGIILNVSESGENNRKVIVLTPEYGVIFCTLYGGPKSKLRSMVQTFNSGTLYFYEDKIKKIKKITDFDVKNFHLSLRTNLYKNCAANLAMELIYKTKCSGDYKNSFKLLSGFLDGMELSSEKECKIALIRFLWRYITLLGILPELRFCSSCEDVLFRSGKNSYYVDSLKAFICEDCISSYKESKMDLITLDRDAITYLVSINELSPKEVRMLYVGEESLNQMKRLVFFLLNKNCDCKLNTLEIGLNIL